MDSKEFLFLRNRMNKTQRQMAQLLGTSEKAIQSYEQGWRNIPIHVERHVLFLTSRRRENKKNTKPCWVIRKCPPERVRKCPAWEFKAGGFCWFINGTICEGEPREDWEEKMKICRSCEVFSQTLSY